MSTDEQHGFPIIGAEISNESNKNSATRSGGSAIDKRISAEKIQSDIERLAKIASSQKLSQANSNGMNLTQIKMNVAVSASGEVGFVFAGADVKAEASIELIFSRK